IHRVLRLDDMSLATSGDYRNYYERDGRRISHTLDPRTGQPVDHGLASVSVLHTRATWADAWATALNVLGPEAGLALAQEEDLAAYFILRTGTDQFEVRATPPFERYWVPVSNPPGP
ncbi:MAG: FAD:protein FMN transferase, partial [Myxococcota bacterium]